MSLQYSVSTLLPRSANFGLSWLKALNILRIQTYILSNLTIKPIKNIPWLRTYEKIIGFFSHIVSPQPYLSTVHPPYRRRVCLKIGYPKFPGFRSSLFPLKLCHFRMQLFMQLSPQFNGHSTATSRRLELEKTALDVAQNSQKPTKIGGIITGWWCNN